MLVLSVETTSWLRRAAVGLAQEAVWQETYAPRVPAQIAEQFTSAGFASAWRRSLSSPPEGVYALLVACAGEQVVRYAAIGPSQDLDAAPVLVGGVATGH